MDEQVKEKYRQGGGSSYSINNTVAKKDPYEDQVTYAEELSNEIAINHHGEVTAATIEDDMERIVEEAIEEYGGGDTAVDLSSYSSPVSRFSTNRYSSKLIQDLMEDDEEDEEKEESN